MPRKIGAHVRLCFTVSLPSWDSAEISVAMRAACLKALKPQGDGVAAELSTGPFLTVEEPASSEQQIRVERALWYNIRYLILGA